MLLILIKLIGLNLNMVNLSNHLLGIVAVNFMADKNKQLSQRLTFLDYICSYSIMLAV